MSTIAAKTVALKDGKRVVIRSAQPDDARQVIAHVRAILEEGEFVLSTLEDYHMAEEQGATWTQANNVASRNVVIVAESEGQIVGMINFSAGTRKRIAHMGEFSMSVNKQWRNLGLGRALLVALLE